MADNNSSSSKRQNNAVGKVVTPKTATPTTTTAGGSGAQQLDTMDALRKSLGARIRLTTLAPDSQILEGSLLAADPLTNLIALNTRPASSNTNHANHTNLVHLHLIPVSKIQTFHVLSLLPAEASPLVAIGAVDLKRLRQREEEKVAKLKEQVRDRGPGVSKEGQDLFDAFKRINVPVRWHGTQIIAHNSVIIMPPYMAEDCKAPKEAQDTLNRVRKVLDGERKKLRQREEKAKAEAEERKGG